MVAFLVYTILSPNLLYSLNIKVNNTIYFILSYTLVWELVLNYKELIQKTLFG